MPGIKVLIADDHALVRMGLRLLISSIRDLTLVGEAKDGEDAVRLALRLHPDVIVMDLLMPRKDGIEATREIRQKMPDVQVVILTSNNTSDGLAHALRSGANGAVLKSETESELVTAIRAVARGERYVTEEISNQIADDPPVGNLSPRQLDVLASVTRGLSNADIARELGISEVTVKTHVATIFEKLGVANRVEAAAIALRKQLLKS